MVAQPAAPPPVLDRRARRRLETIEEVLDVAVQIMGEQGVAGLSIGEIARRMGMRPPSLYVYFPSKHALYDALFARGARLVLEAMQPVRERDVTQRRDLEALLLDAAQAFTRWCIQNPAYSQLLFWRPVPGFTPSPEAYAPALELLNQNRERFIVVQRSGLLRDDVAAEDMHLAWTVLVSGVVSQQLSNAPEETFEEGRFTRYLPEVVAMFARHYAAAPAASPPGGRHGADQG